MSGVICRELSVLDASVLCVLPSASAGVHAFPGFKPVWELGDAIQVIPLGKRMGSVGTASVPGIWVPRCPCALSGHSTSRSI